MTPVHTGRVWALAAALLSLYFLLWWTHLRPGVFSFDSGYYLEQVRSGALTNLKPYFFGRFLQLVTLGGSRMEFAAIVQAALVVLAFSRMLAVAYASGARGVWIAFAVVLMVNPYVANMIFYVQNDILFAVAIATITVETLFIVRSGAASPASCLMLALFAPMALLFRQNGILFLPLWGLVVLLVLPRRLWARVLLAPAVLSLLAMATIVGVARGVPSKEQDLLYPAIVHEAVNLARPGYQRAIGARLAPQTRQAIGQKRLTIAVGYYTPLFWDSIAFHSMGRDFQKLPRAQRDAIARSFLRRDLLPNLPAIVAHRVEVFTGALLARGQLADPYYAPPNLPPRLGQAKARFAAAEGDASTLGRVNRWAIASRGWMWNALLGLCVLAALAINALWRRDLPLLFCVLLLLVQAGAILVVAPSAEYRYVFPVYLAPMLLLVGHRMRTRTSENGVESRPASAVARRRGAVAPGPALSAARGPA